MKKGKRRIDIITKPISELKPYPGNPRRISPSAQAALNSSLDRFGLVEPIVWNRRSGHVIGGHQRLELVRARGEKEVAVAVVDLSETDEKALNVALNNPALAGEFTDSVEHILAELKRAAPDVFDELLLWKVAAPAGRGGKKAKAIGEHDLSPAPYESYNYVVLLFKNDIDWTAALEHFQLKQVRDSFVGTRRSEAIGLGRVVEGGAYLKRIREKRG